MTESPSNVIDVLYREYSDYYQYLMDASQISFANDYKSQFSKIILLATASHFENQVVASIGMMLNPSRCRLTTNFIENKALKRQYHTLFDWDGGNANKFFAYFGDDFKQFMIREIGENNYLGEAVKDFLKLGSLRNQLVHQNYATFSVPLTADEIYQKFLKAREFVEQLGVLASQYTSAQPS